MATIHFTSDTFQTQVKEEKKTTLVDFSATWCGPCKMLAPVIDELSEELDGTLVGKIDIDEEQELAVEYGVMSVPTVILFKDGAEVTRLVGVRPKQAYLDLIAE